jgi:hypothetical protein
MRYRIDVKFLDPSLVDYWFSGGLCTGEEEVLMRTRFLEEYYSDVGMQMIFRVVPTAPTLYRCC